MTSMICAGFGGQGVLTAGLILAKTAMDQGDNVTWIPSYGSEMRGGTANCNVKIAKDKIASPFVRECSLLIALNPPSVAKFMPMLVPGGLLITNSTLVKNHPFRSDIRVAEVEASAIADSLGNTKGVNIIMLGALAATGELYPADVIREGIDRFFTEKNKKTPKNMDAFEEGLKQCRFAKN